MNPSPLPALLSDDVSSFCIDEDTAIVVLSTVTMSSDPAVESDAIAVSASPTRDMTRLQYYFLRVRQNPGFLPPAYLVPPDGALRAAYAEDAQEHAASTSGPFWSHVHPPPEVRSLSERRADFTPAQLEAAEVVRTRLGEKGILPLFDDWALYRYCVARKFDVEKTVQMACKSAEWLTSYGPAARRCRLCETDPASHLLTFVGWDNKHRPVMYSSFKYGRDRSNAETATEHSVEALQHAVSLMPVGVEQLIIVTDFVGFSYITDGNPKVSSSFIGILQDHFPERLAAQILIDPPTMFWVLWKVLQPFIDVRTKEKVLFVYTEKQPNMRDVFADMFPPALAEYLMATFRANKAR